MPFKYQKLWDMLEYRDMTRSELRAKIKVSQSTITNMGKNENVSLDVIDKICTLFDCTPNDIMEYYKPIDINAAASIKTGDIFNIFLDEESENKNELTPVVVIQSNDINSFSPTIIVSPLHEVDDKFQENATVIIIKADKYNFSKDYFIDTHILHTVNKKFFKEKIGTISELDLKRMMITLITLLGYTQQSNDFE